MSADLALVVNPAAGGGRCGRRADRFVARLRDRGVSVTRVDTAGPGDAARLAAERPEAAVVAVGGDGTLHEVVNGLMARDRPRPALGLLPLGTGNSFARDFGIDDPERAFDALVRGERRPVDVLRVDRDGGALFSVNLVSLGFVAEVGDLTNRRFKALGPAGYVLATLVTVARLRPSSIPVTVGGARDDRPGVFLCFCNSQYTGGSMRMAPSADPADGALDIVRVGPMSRRRLLRLFPRIFDGTHVSAPEIETSRAERVELHLDRPIPALVDGEALSLRLRAVEVVPAALELVA